jgi:hypothetical protein
MHIQIIVKESNLLEKKRKKEKRKNINEKHNSAD